MNSLSISADAITIYLTECYGFPFRPLSGTGAGYVQDRMGYHSGQNTRTQNGHLGRLLAINSPSRQYAPRLGQESQSTQSLGYPESNHICSVPLQVGPVYQRVAVMDPEFPGMIRIRRDDLRVPELKAKERQS